MNIDYHVPVDACDFEQVQDFHPTGFKPNPTPRFQDLQFHSWYTSVMAFPDHLVDSIIGALNPSPRSVLFDPHCGSGTALVQAQKHGLRAFGIDANPASVLISQAKTNWNVDSSRVRYHVEELESAIKSMSPSDDDPILDYLNSSGMLERGWIEKNVAQHAISFKRWIDLTIASLPIRKLFLIALVSTIVHDVSNVRFGPELYCTTPPDEPKSLFDGLRKRLSQIETDLEAAMPIDAPASVKLGDSRDGRTIRFAADWNNGPVVVITSPPYPTEHDYTRNSRLELVFLEQVSGLRSLRRIKRRMIRSHTKGIYTNDRDSRYISKFRPVESIQRSIEAKLAPTMSGFEKMYPLVIGHYFGGMVRHFQIMARYLPSGSRLAYVVGEQASYKSVFVPTADILVECIDQFVPKLSVESIAGWRTRRATLSGVPLEEHVIFMTAQ